MDRDQGWDVPLDDIWSVCFPCCQPLRQRGKGVAILLIIMSIVLIGYFGFWIYQPGTHARSLAKYTMDHEKKQGKLSKNREILIKHYIVEMDENVNFFWIALIAKLPALVVSCAIFPVVRCLAAESSVECWQLLFVWIIVLLGLTTPAQVYLLVKIVMAMTTHEGYPFVIVPLGYEWNFKPKYVMSLIFTVLDLPIVIYADFVVTKFIYYTLQERRQVGPDPDPEDEEIEGEVQPDVLPGPDDDSD